MTTNTANAPSLAIMGNSKQGWTKFAQHWMELLRFGALIKASGHAFLEERDDDSSELLEVQDLKTTWGDLTDASGS
jgi:hypothetical protein